MRRSVIAVLATALTIGLVGWAVPPAQSAPTAPAGRLVYVCGQNLCAVDPATGARAQITSDGDSGAAYRAPSISADGGTVAAARNGDVVVGAYGANLTAAWLTEQNILGVALQPDGSAVTETHSYVRNEVRLCWPGPYTCLQLVAHNDTSYTTPDGTSRSYNGGSGTSFLGASTLLSASYDITRDAHYVCAVANPAAESQDCAEVFAVAQTISSIAGSPTGEYIAATLSDGDAPSSVQLYSAAGAPVRGVAANAGSPAFSPDGRWLAYAADDGWIYAQPTAGGTPVRLVQGAAPAWGGGAVAGDPGLSSGTAKVRGVKKKGVPVRKRTVRLTVACTGGTPCAGQLVLTVKKGKRKAAIAKPKAYTVPAGAQRKVAVKLTPKGLKIVRKKKVTKAVATVGGNRTTIRIRR